MIDGLLNRPRTELLKVIPRRLTALGQRIKDYPKEWFASTLNDAVLGNRVSEAKAKVIGEQMQDPKAVSQLTDIFVCSVGIRAVLKPVDIAIIGAAAYHEDPLIALGVIATHSAGRLAYLGSRVFYDRVLSRNPNIPTLKRDMMALGAAAFPIVGNLAAPWRAHSSYPELATFAMSNTGHKLNNLLRGSEPNSYNLPTVYRPGL